VIASEMMGPALEHVIKFEMVELRTILRNAKAEAVPFLYKIFALDGTASFEVGRSIENCAEVWAVRNAILSGVKLENIVLRTISYESGEFAELCQNCQRTFKNLIEFGRIISD